MSVGVEIEREGDHVAARDDVGNDVVAKVAGGAFGAGVALQLLDQHRGTEDVDAHGRQGHVGVSGHGRGVLGFLDELADAVVVVDAHHAEARGLLQWHLYTAHRDVRLGLDEGREHRAVVHLVDVVARQYQHELRVVAADDIDVLVDRVGGAGIPRSLDTLLRRQQLHELAQLAAHEAPAALHVAYQAVRLVLGQDGDLADTRVDAVRQWEVDDAELAAEGHRRLGAPHSELFEARPAPPGQHHGQCIARQPADVSCRILIAHQ